MQEPSIFTRIINGEIPAHRIYEDDQVIAFLTINPVIDGHVLVVPKKQVEQLWDMDGNDFTYLWETAKKIAIHLRNVMEVDKVGVVVKGFEVPHTHIHLIPVSQNNIISFDPEIAPPTANSEHLSTLAKKLKM